MKEREYLYTIEVRVGDSWERKQQVATSIVEVSRLLRVKLDDLRYITKEKT
jgi:hypothetical protein